jgi:hypothetical protein
MADMPLFALLGAVQDTVAVVPVTLDDEIGVGACADEPWLATIVKYPVSRVPDVGVDDASHTGCVETPYSVNEVANAAVAPKYTRYSAPTVLAEVIALKPVRDPS